MTYDESIYPRRSVDDPDTFDDPDGTTARGERVAGHSFDDPGHGESGRDRLAVHLVWEVVLLAAVVAVSYLLYEAEPGAVRGAALDGLLVSASALGLLALAAGLSLRAAVPNLAIGPVAVAVALHVAENGDRGVVAAILPAALVAVGLGLAVAVLVVGFHVPAWAASLAAALGAMVFIQQRTGPVTVQGGYDPTRTAFYLFAGFAAVAVLGGLFGTIKSVRRAVGRFRPLGDPAQRRGTAAGLLAATALVASMVLATASGLLIATGGTGTVRPTTGLEWTGLAIGAALLGGSSAFGRRGGVFGLLLSVALLTLFLRYEDERGWDIALTAIAAVTVAAGLVVTRLVESLGRPRRVVGEFDADWATDSGGSGGWSTGSLEHPSAWSAALPPQPAEPRPDPWGMDRWGATDR
ncbi:ABC transporter permease [Plantactinospora sp. GCM10030261]|uniref:ABC transporter permease n=1 Tax=Plantactinospora sp. GCM10030261 TaxID=3273420 RepID=UPI003621973B